MAVRSTPAHVFRENNILETQKQLVQVLVSLRRLVATVTAVKTPNPSFRRMWSYLGNYHERLYKILFSQMCDDYP